MKPYSLRDSTVLYDGRAELRFGEVSTAVLRALRRKLRLRHYDADFFHTLAAKGEASITWNFTRNNKDNDNAWVTFQAFMQGEDLQLLCMGPKAELAIDRVNKGLRPKSENVPRSEKIHAARLTRAQRAHAKRRKKKAQKLLERQANTPPTAPKKSRIKEVRKASGQVIYQMPSRMALRPQFKNTRVFWQEAVDLVRYTFQLCDAWSDREKRLVTKEQIAKKWILEALEKTRDKATGLMRYAQLCEGNFHIQLEVVGGRWRGDITPFAIYATNDHADRRYRRLRKRMHAKLQGHSAPLQAQRRIMYEQAIAA